jgi:hypothetical protein
MDPTKPWYASKAVWATLLTSLLGLYEVLGTYTLPTFGIHVPTPPDFIYFVLGSVGLYGRISATKTIGS